MAFFLYGNLCRKIAICIFSHLCTLLFCVPWGLVGVIGFGIPHLGAYMDISTSRARTEIFDGTIWIFSVQHYQGGCCMSKSKIRASWNIYPGYIVIISNFQVHFHKFPQLASAFIIRRLFGLSSLCILKWTARLSALEDTKSHCLHLLVIY